VSVNEMPKTLELRDKK